MACENAFEYSDTGEYEEGSEVVESCEKEKGRVECLTDNEKELCD